MSFDKCDKCESTVKVKRPKQGYALPLLIFFSGLLALAYERNLSESNVIIAVLGTVTAIAGFIWLIMRGVAYYRS